MGIIYIIRNIVNYKIYIGQTIHTLHSRWNSHLSAFRNKDNSKSWALYGAFKKYGIDNFVIIRFKNCDDDKLDEIETHYIKVFGSMCPNGYNIRSGGKTGQHCEESREKMRQAKLGPNNPNFGKPRSEKFKQLMSVKKSGENHHYFGKNLDPVHLEKLSVAHKKDGPSEGLPMYMVYVKARPEYYCSEGYAIVNHPTAKNKYFTSKSNTLEEKRILAQQYLNNFNNPNNIKDQSTTT